MQLLITADVKPGGWIQVGAAPRGEEASFICSGKDSGEGKGEGSGEGGSEGEDDPPEALRVACAVPMIATATYAPMRYEAGADWSSLVGRAVALEIRITAASLYSIGWTGVTAGRPSVNAPPSPPPHAPGQPFLSALSS